MRWSRSEKKNKRAVVVQLMSACASLWISCTTAKKLPYLFFFPLLGNCTFFRGPILLLFRNSEGFSAAFSACNFEPPAENPSQHETRQSNRIGPLSVQLRKIANWDEWRDCWTLSWWGNRRPWSRGGRSRVSWWWVPGGTPAPRPGPRTHWRQWYKNRSSRKIDSHRLFSRE